MNYSQFNSYEGEIDSFESIYNDFSINSTEIIVPWLNVGIYEHPLNPKGIDNIMYISNCYFLIKGVAVVLKNGELVYNTKSIKKNNYNIFSIEGVNINTGSLDGFELICDESYLLIPEDYDSANVSYLRDKYEFLARYSIFLSKE